MKGLIMSEIDKSNTAAPNSGKTPGWFARHRATWIIVILGVLMLIGLNALLAQPEKGFEPTERELEKVTLEKVVPRRVEDTLALAGDVEPALVVNIASETDARVKSFAGCQDKYDLETFTVTPGPAEAGVIQEGARVVKGQPLVYLNDDLEQAQYEQAKAVHKFRLLETDRIKLLHTRGAATMTELDRSSQELSVAGSLLRVAEARLERCVIVAPGDGIVNLLPVEVGEYVRKGKEVAQIVEPRYVDIVVHVPERDIDYFSMGQEVEIVPVNGGQVPITGKITYISELADRASRKTRVEVKTHNPRDAKGHRKFRNGQIVQMKLTRQRLEGAVMIPLRAILPTEQGQVVYVLGEDDVALRRHIEVDRHMIQGDRIRVKNGLQAGDMLIVDGNRYVGPGQTVRVVAPTVPASAVTVQQRPITTPADRK
jgi:membrane fusion protein (multidrug efflux system)